MMRQVFLQKGTVAVRTINSPLVQEQQVLVCVHYSFISSGTEIATLKSSQTPFVQKYAYDAKEQTHKIIGALKEHGVAGTLALAKEKFNKILPLGFSCAGASFAHHADVVSVPQNLVVRVANSTILKYASLTTIGAIALQGVRRAQLQLGEKVCVVGLGLLGQLTLQLARQAGCEVIGIDVKEDRLELAKKLG